jgi:hypothetical protein
MIVLILRIILFLIFAIGVVNSLSKCSGHSKVVIKKLGIVGSLYLLAWPSVVIFAEIALPNYMRR